MPDLAAVLGPVMSLQVEADGALTVRHDGMVASLREVVLAEGLAMISLTQVLAWDLNLNSELRKSVAAQANSAMLGTVALVERPGRKADVMLRYNFPFAGLGYDALRTLILMALDTGAQVRATLTA